MLVGTVEEVDAFLRTTPWGLESAIGWYNWHLDGQPGWSLFLTHDPTTPGSEGIVYAYDRDKKNAAVVGCSSYERLAQLVQETENRPTQELRELALMLTRDVTGLL